jgi:dCMP deaminase
MQLAELVATYSKDASTKVGAVIVDKDNRVVSLGFNGFPKGTNDWPTSREVKLLRTVHAELNAILFAKRDLSGCTIYVTHAPCSHCAAAIIQTGISRVIYKTPSKEYIERWGNSWFESLQMFYEVGMDIDSIGEEK